MHLIYPERSLAWEPLVYSLQELLADGSSASAECYLVGGIVRDAYLQRPSKDVDLVCKGSGLPIARQIANYFQGAYYPLDAERGVGRAIIMYEGEQVLIDVAAMRGASLEADLQDRDFTMNAMAVPLDSDLSGLYDPLGGIASLQQKVLYLCSPSAIANDPLRALRAVRQSFKYEMRIAPKASAIIRRDGVQLGLASAERIRDEFFALFELSRPQSALLVLEHLGLLGLILPEAEALMQGTGDQGLSPWRYTLLVLEKLALLTTIISPRRDDNVGANAGLGTFVYLLDRYRAFWQAHLRHHWVAERQHQALLLFAVPALMALQTPDQIARRGAELRLSAPEIKRLQALRQYHALPLELFASAPLGPRQVYHYWRDTGDAGIDACLFSAALYLAVHGVTLHVPEWTRFLQMIAQLLDGYAPATQVQPIISGNDLMARFQLPPGPQIGQLLEHLREAQVLGEISTPEEAFSLAESLLQA